MRFSGFVIVALLAASPALAQGEAPPKRVAAPAIPSVIAAGTTIEPREGRLPPLFTGANEIVRIDGTGQVSTFVKPSNDANGLGFDAHGRLIAVQRAAGNEKVGVLHPPGGATLADRIGGKPFNRLNDLVVGRSGSIYFTDVDGVYHLSQAGRVARVIGDDIPSPNGVILSPDEQVLYANNKDGEYLLAYDAAPDGALRNRRNFAKYKSLRIPGHKDPLIAEDNGADGLAIDNDGRLYVPTNLGVEIFSPRGEHLGVLPVVWGGESFRLRKPQNVAFAGPDRRTLYIVGAGAVYKVQTIAQGITTRAK